MNRVSALYHAKGYMFIALRTEVHGRKVLLKIVQGQITRETIAMDLRPFFGGLKFKTNLRDDDIIYDSILAGAYAERNGDRLGIGIRPSSNPGGTLFSATTTAIPRYFPLTGNIFVGNYGSRYSSRYLAGGAISYSPGYGINLGINGAQGLPSLTHASAGSQYTQGNLNANTITPWGNYGFTAGWTHYRIGKIAYPLNPTGNIFTWGLTGSQLLYGTYQSRWSVNEGYNHVSNQVKVYQSIFAGGYPLTTQNYNYFSLGSQWNSSYDLLGATGSYGASCTYNQGVNGSHGTLVNGIPSLPAARFHYFDATIMVTQPLPLGMSASFTASGQGAFNTLPSQQQWVLGGFGNLSAYYPSVLVGDSGYSGRFLVQSPSWRFHGFRVNGSIYAEVGAVTTTFIAPHTHPWQSLSDVGLGVNISSPWGTTLSALSAVPTGHIHVNKAVLTSNRVYAYFVLSQNF